MAYLINLTKVHINVSFLIAKGSEFKEMKRITKAGIDGCNFEIVLSGINKDIYLESQPLINSRNMIYGEVSAKSGKAFVGIVLPLFIRSNNANPFSILDMIKLDEINDNLESQLKNIFGDINDNYVKSIECNITLKTLDGCTCHDMLHMINISYPDDKAHIVEGKGRRLKKEYNKDKESLKIPRLHYYDLKCYNKSLEQSENGNFDVENGLFRIEIVMKDRILKKLFNNKTRINDILTKNNLLAVLAEYKRILLDEIISEHIGAGLLANFTSKCRLWLGVFKDILPGL